MKLQLRDDMTHIVIMDVSGLYSQVYDEMFVPEKEVDRIKHTYGDAEKWKVVIID